VQQRRVFPFFPFTGSAGAGADKPDGEGLGATTAVWGTGSASDCETPHEGRASYRRVLRRISQWPAVEAAAAAQRPAKGCVCADE